jgi:hypothetical protein
MERCIYHYHFVAEEFASEGLHEESFYDRYPLNDCINPKYITCNMGVAGKRRGSKNASWNGHTFVNYA